MFKTILAHFVKLAQKLLIIYFYECSHTKQFWKDFKNFWFALSGKHVELQDVLIGKLGKVSELLNYFIIIAKWNIGTSHKQSLNPNITVLKK